MIAKGSSKKAYDTHVRKESHMATPVDAKTEFHLRTDEVPFTCVPGETYTLLFPVICTSADDESMRLRQVGKPYLQKSTVYKEKKMSPNRS